MFEERERGGAGVKPYNSLEEPRPSVDMISTGETANISDSSERRSEYHGKHVLWSGFTCTKVAFVSACHSTRLKLGGMQGKGRTGTAQGRLVNLRIQ